MRILRTVLITGLAAVAFLLAALVVGQAQDSQPVFRIGVLDNERGSISNGARLAVQTINQNGGVTNAQGITVRLELVVESPSYPNSLEDAILHLGQASVNLVLGPETTKDVLTALSLLQSLGVPILTPATGDTIIVSDSTQLIFRIRAAERLEAAALADYLAVYLNAKQIVSVQLDQASIKEQVGFFTALSQQADPPQTTVLLYDEDTGTLGLVANIIERNPQVVVAYGPPLRASRLYTQLRQAGWVGKFAYNRATEPAFNKTVPFDELHGILSTTTWSLDTPTNQSKAFVDSYVADYDAVPGPIEAASYDAIYLLAEAISLPGDLKSNLSTVRDFPGVQGILNPTGLSQGAMSDTVAVIQLNGLGGSDLRIRYARGKPVPPGEEIVTRPTNTPAPTATAEAAFLTIMSSVQNVRTGPSLQYPVLGQMSQGETARLIGASIDFSWVVINFRGQQGWLATYLLETTGDLSVVPVISAPPPPTPIPLVIVPTSAPVPIYIGIQSPMRGNIVAGSVPIIGSALHPQFLQYQIEFGPDPNPQGIWTLFGIVYTPVYNGLLGTWNTPAVADGLYQIRLSVILRDGITLASTISGIRVQNLAPVPVPTAIPVVPPPIAAFTPDRSAGEAPLTVHFINQSSGSISQIAWNFGDGTTSTETHPSHTFGTPNIYTVTLEVTGPGGTSNFAWQINVRGPSAPVAAFSADKTTGISPMTVQFTSLSTGAKTSYVWNFGDGTISQESNPIHTFANAGLYNVILTVTGSGGASIATHQIRVESPQIPAPDAQFRTNPTSGVAPQSVQFTDESTGEIGQYSWNFGDGTLSNERSPLHKYIRPGNYIATLIVTGPGGLDSAQTVITVLTLLFTDSFDTGQLFTWTTGAGWMLVPSEGGQALQVSNSEEPVTFKYNTLFDLAAQARFQINAGAIRLSVRESAAGRYSAILDVNGQLSLYRSETVLRTVVFSPSTPGQWRVLRLSAISGLVRVSVDGMEVIAVQDPSPLPMGTISFSAVEIDASTLLVDDFELWTRTIDLPLTSDVPNVPPAETPTATATQTPTATSTATQTLVPSTVTPPMAAFIWDVGEGQVPLTVHLTNQSTGEITTYSWDFGDGGTSAEMNPVYTYNTAGTYTLTLTVAGPGGSSTAQSPITVRELLVVTPTNIAGIKPIIPDLSSAEVQARLREIYQAGLVNGNRPTVFAVAGDESAMRPDYLDPFAAQATYTLDDRSQHLQGIIDWYNLTALDGSTSFGRAGAATGEGWTVADLINPSKNDPNVCEGGESPLLCELRLTHPSAVIISIGYYDALQSADANTFVNRLQEVVQMAVNSGVIPILSTIPPRSDGTMMPEQIQTVNELIMEVANQNQVPVFNLWRAFAELPDSGLSADGVTPSVSPSGPGDLTVAATSSYGANARNFHILTTLDALRSTIFPDAAAP